MIIENFDLNKVMTHVFECGVLMRDSGSWAFWLDDSDFDKGIEALIFQNPNEDFEQFIKRVIEKLIELEAKEEYPPTAINYAIYCLKNELNQNQ